MTSDDTPAAIPGFERLRWQEPALSIPLVPKHNHMAQLLTCGDDVGIVLAVQSAGRPCEHVASITLGGAFTQWPPAVGPLVLHREVALWNRPPKLATRPDGQVLVWSGEPFTFAWGREGSVPFAVDAAPVARAPRAFGAPPDVLVVGEGPKSRTLGLVRDGSPTRIAHREADGSITDLGALPASASHVVVQDDGTLIAIVVHAPAPDDGANVTRITTTVLPTTEGSGTTFDLPPRVGVQTLIAAHGGGAWILCHSMEGETVVRLDAAGHPVGQPWRAPFGRGSSPALARWREGFVLYTQRSGIALIASDGTCATRVEGKPGGEPDVAGDVHSIAISGDARSMVLCHRTTRGIQVLRADFSSATSSEQRPDPWEVDRVEYAALVERRAKHAAAPRLPGRPVETSKRGETVEQLHAKDRIVRQVRVRHILSTISGLYFAGFSYFRGDDDAGEYWREDGCGGTEYFGWSTDGLVGVSDDADLPGYLGEEKTPENAVRCFPEAPTALLPLVQRAIAVTRGSVSGGLWVTTGDTPSWLDEGCFRDDFDRFVMTPEAAIFASRPHQSWLDLSSLTEAHGKLAIALAEKSSAGLHTLSAEEEAVMLTPPIDRSDVRADHVAAAVKALAAVGITWRDPPRVRA